MSRRKKTKNKVKVNKNSQGMAYIHSLYYMCINGPIKKEDFEEKIFGFLKDNNLLFPEDLNPLKGRETRSHPENIYQILRNLKESNDALSPSYFINESATHYTLARPVFESLQNLLISRSGAKLRNKKKVPDHLPDMENVIFYGPPGTGKTFRANQENSKCKKIVIQFHPSYSYENFVQGERLVSIGDMRLTQVVDGPLICAYRKATGTPARSKVKVINVSGDKVTFLFPIGILGRYDFNPGEQIMVSTVIDVEDQNFVPSTERKGDKISVVQTNHGLAANDVVEIDFMSADWSLFPSQVLLIDEINRADVAKVFGELLNALSDPGGPQPNGVQLQYSGENFKWPGNMRIIGTMNSADRSIGEFDQAAKRRFRFIEIKPDHKILSSVNLESLAGTKKILFERPEFANLPAFLKSKVEKCEANGDGLVALYNGIGKLHGLNSNQFCYLPLPSKSLNNLHDSILASKEAILRVHNKLIGHSFHISFVEDISELVKTAVKKGVFSDRKTAIELSDLTKRRCEILLQQEIRPQIESLCMGNEALLEKIMKGWMERDLLAVVSPNDESSDGHNVSNSKPEAA